MRLRNMNDHTFKIVILIFDNDFDPEYTINESHVTQTNHSLLVIGQP